MDVSFSLGRWPSRVSSLPLEGCLSRMELCHASEFPKLLPAGLSQSSAAPVALWARERDGARKTQQCVAR